MSRSSSNTTSEECVDTVDPSLAEIRKRGAKRLFFQLVRKYLQQRMIPTAAEQLRLNGYVRDITVEDFISWCNKFDHTSGIVFWGDKIEFEEFADPPTEHLIGEFRFQFNEQLCFWPGDWRPFYDTGSTGMFHN